MSPARGPAQRREQVRLLLVDRSTDEIGDHRFEDLPSLLSAGDLLVVNDAATLPASLAGHTERGEAVELRLLEAPLGTRVRAVALGAGDFHVDTNDRPAVPKLEPGDVLRFEGGLEAVVGGVGPRARRLELSFAGGGAARMEALYRAGRPVQYSHHVGPLELWSFQTVYGVRPWSVEMPSAGRPLTARMLIELRRRGIDVVRITHAAGLSATGDRTLDAALPLRERFSVPPETVAAIEQTRDRGGRVIAVGTSVVRALESAFHEGKLRAAMAETELRIDAEHRVHVVDGILTGMHEAGESHFDLLRAFAPAELLARVGEHANAKRYRSHEFGDVTLIVGFGCLRRATRSAEFERVREASGRTHDHSV